MVSSNTIGPAPSVAVFAPNSSVTVTIESDGDGDDDIHFHAGGQGVWIARTILRLGEDPRLCTPTGGESGRVLEALIGRDGIGLCAVRVQRETGAYVHDRRGGERHMLAENVPAGLRRHELDDLYQAVLADALGTGLIVVTGRRRPNDLPDSFYRRLGRDLARTNVRVVGDLHGAELAALLDGGAIDLLKVSSEDLADDGVAVGSDGECLAAIASLRERGVADVVLTRGSEPALAVIGGELFSATAVAMESPDHRGSGDAMTGALVVGMIRHLDAADLLALGCGAGAASATRHGMATADARLIAELANLCHVERLDL